MDAAIRAWARDESARRPEIVRLGYFGSYARGDWGPGSDLDVVAVVTDSELPFERRATAWNLLALPVPADLLVYTAAEWRDLLARNDRFARMLATETTWVLGAPLARDDLLKRVKEALEKRPAILEAYLFGSQALGRAQVHSDVDVAVYLAEIPDAPFGFEAELAADLMSAVGDSRVDVLLLNRAPPLLYHRVLRDGVRLLSRDLRATTVREGQALSRYCDYALQLAKIDVAIRRRIDRGDFGR